MDDQNMPARPYRQGRGVRKAGRPLHRTLDNRVREAITAARQTPQVRLDVRTTHTAILARFTALRQSGTPNQAEKGDALAFADSDDVMGAGGSQVVGAAW
ncbi:hypothetical protein ACF1BN_37455 [Streptomyces sp. NPDC014861]|uniref:hypothetical protein n=1 Tax=Streptomyces sp. NPDC014861 TaxID=3364923 RepID=UPI0036FF3B43